MTTRVPALVLVLLAALPSAGAVLEGVDVTAANGVTARLTMSAPVIAHTTTLRAPDRLVIDLPATDVARGVKPVVAGRSPIVRVRIARHDTGTVRVVFDLEHPATFTTRTEGSTVVVSLAGPGPHATEDVAVPEQPRTAASAPEAPPTAATRTAAPVLQYRDPARSSGRTRLYLDLGDVPGARLPEDDGR